MRRRRAGTRIIINGLALVAIVFFVFPVYWMVATAFKPSGDIQLPTPKLFPSPLTLQHFVDGFNKHHFWDNARSSVIVTCTVVILAMLVAFFAAAALARFRFRGRKAYLVLLLVVQMVPFEAMLIPIFIELNRLGLVYHLVGVIIAYLAFVLPFTIWTLRGFVQGVPPDLEEAALCDGCTRAQAFMKILFPLIAPGLVATAIFAFMQAWNEYIFANVLLTNDNATLPVWLASFFSAGGQIDWGGIMAGSTLFALPVIALFMLVQGRITTGLTAGAVKG
ncbi:MAG TPA: carbohydrate ABC transporter permease [Candidatus Dormibacteraeota bacterium]